MGAEDTLLYQKVTSEKGAVPLHRQQEHAPRHGDDDAEDSRGRSREREELRVHDRFMHENKLDWWLDAGLPKDVDSANKAGWLYRVYDEVGFVEHDGHRYVIAILSKHGSADVYGGQDMIKHLSEDVWESQTQPQEDSDEPKESEGLS